MIVTGSVARITPDGQEAGSRMLGVDWDTARLFCMCWPRRCGLAGSRPLAALVPAIRGLGAQVSKVAARRFNQIAWLAFAVLVLTGIWNVGEGHRQLPCHPDRQAGPLAALFSASCSPILVGLRHIREVSMVAACRRGLRTGQR